MLVVFNCLSREPIENIVTCLNYKVDKVVFYGDAELINSSGASTENFLKKYCEVDAVEFWRLPQDDMQSIIRTMHTVMSYEAACGNDVFCDITGGEGLILAGLGAIADKYGTTTFMYDVPANKIIEVQAGNAGCIGDKTIARRITMTLDMYFELIGGAILSSSEVLDFDEDSEDEADFQNLLAVVNKYPDSWVKFVAFTSNYLNGNGLHASIAKKKLLMKFRHADVSITATKYRTILEDLSQNNIILNLNYSGDVYEFDYKNASLKHAMSKVGTILELYVYHKERRNYDDCRTGVRVDWKVDAHSKRAGALLNEIDVIAIRNNVPVFISCKSGRMQSAQTLFALYELNIIAEAIGGKYAQKVLVVSRKMLDMNIAKASELGVEVRRVRLTEKLEAPYVYE